MAQARQRKAANLARQEVLKKERAASIGDPVRGITTPWVESLDNVVATSVQPRPPQKQVADPTTEDTTTQTPEVVLRTPNYYLSPDEVQSSLEYSKSLTEPIVPKNRGKVDPEKETADAEIHRQAHENAQTAISRIVLLANGNSKDRTRVNIQRCIDKFGRHHTDEYLPPKPAASTDPLTPAPAEPLPRVGPDTGSPEVQVAILTAKIRVLSKHLETTRKDKHNKRNLRVLVHRRQKQLTYLRRKERGGPRWQNLIETLGLTDGTWKGEISL